MMMAYNAEESLRIVEVQIKEQAEKFTRIKKGLEEADRELSRLAKLYKEQRGRFTRDAWRAVGLGWCCGCQKLCPVESVKFLYTEGREWHGSHGYESFGLHKRIRSFCDKCANYHLSMPRGGKSELQCFVARKREEGFEIFVSGRWAPVSEPHRVIVEIEKPYILESEYRSGKPIIKEGFPFTTKLTIGEEKVI